jgi:hypothetical protein
MEQRGRAFAFIAFSLAALAALGSCASAPGLRAYRTAARLAAPLSADELAVLASAKELVGLPPEAKVLVNGRSYTLDCIGTVSAIYYKVGIDVQKDFAKFEGNGVRRLFKSLEARGAIHRDRIPRPGDVIVWDNTWDANGDGDRGNDPYTHAGIVVSVSPDGTMRYVHEHIRRGIVVESMNLLRPADYYGEDGSVINSALAMSSGVGRKDNPPHWTSGDLWEAFGDVLREREHFRAALGGFDEAALVASMDGSLLLAPAAE